MYHGPRITDVTAHEAWAIQMKHLVDRENQLKTRLEGLVIGRDRPRWRKSDSSMIPLPVLSEGNMRSLCFDSEIFF